MKKYLLVFLLTLFVGNASAQMYSYRGFQAAYKLKVDNTWSDWSNWQSVNVLITIDYDRDVIKVYAEMQQTYRIYEYDGKFTDVSGGQQVQFSVIDQDGDIGKVRLRVETNGNSQLYVDFADVTFCWNVRKIK